MVGARIGEFLNEVALRVEASGCAIVSLYVIHELLRDPGYDHPIGPAVYAFAGLPSPDEQWLNGLRVRGLAQAVVPGDYKVLVTKPAPRQLRQILRS